MLINQLQIKLKYSRSYSLCTMECITHIWAYFNQPIIVQIPTALVFSVAVFVATVVCLIVFYHAKVSQDRLNDQAGNNDFKLKQ